MIIMNIAILGATSQIAKDLIISFSESDSLYKLWMFSRSPSRVKGQFDILNKIIEYPNLEYKDFSNDDDYDVIINCVGVGDPAKAEIMGSSIFEVTEKYDNMALNYVKENTSCKYIFLSSGAVYGDNFDNPVDASSNSIIDINSLGSKDWYSIAKIYSESKHRSYAELNIIDVRVFNYFSSTVDLNSGFLITQALRSVKEKQALITDSFDLYRDYATPKSMFNLIVRIVNINSYNGFFDCCSSAIVSKFDLLNFLSDNYGLVYHVENKLRFEGCKVNYYSLNKKNYSLLGCEFIDDESKNVYSEIKNFFNN